MRGSFASQAASMGPVTKQAGMISAEVVMKVCGAALLCVALATSATAQLTQDDIDALRKQGEIEGWTFTVDLNGAAQYSMDELCGVVEPPNWEQLEQPRHLNVTRDLPASYDWRDFGGCTPIRNQGGCGSCWAFSAVGAVECSVLINDGISTDLSEQWLVSCTAAGSCNGGWPTSALGFMKREARWTDGCGDSGAVLEADFPYVAWNAPCGCPYDHPYWIHDFAGVQNDVAQIKQAIMEYGPVSTLVYVSGSFQGYSGGIYNACPTGPLNHAVVLVGWDDNQGSDGVWIMRNSWGRFWGEDGYMRIEYDCSKIGQGTNLVLYRGDCNGNGIRDDWDIAQGTSSDCDIDGTPDECQIADGSANDCNLNNVPDHCDLAGAGQIHVDAQADGAATGADWANALTDLESALCMAENDPAITEIWVRTGTYTPAGGNRSATIQLRSGVVLRGGFDGTESSPAERDLSDPANRTILSGDLNGDDLPGLGNRSDNSYHVVTAIGVDASAGLDGFTITGGNANGVGTDRFGGGVFCAEGSPTITNCMFIGNQAALAGGGMHNEGEEYGSNVPCLINSVFCGNEAGSYGGAVSSYGTLIGAVNPTFTNCTFATNHAMLVGGVYSQGNTAVTLANCVLWANTNAGGSDETAQLYGDGLSVNCCCIQGLTGAIGGTGNIDTDPRFVNTIGADGIPGTMDDNVHLASCSPCTDAGNNAFLPPEVLTDADGSPRFVDDQLVPDTGFGGPPVVDLGAFEFNGLHPGDLDGDGDVDLSDLSTMLANYPTASGASPDDGDLDGDGDVDLSDLSALLAVYGTGC